jgi:cell division protein FtsI (penicillin-binding protein 3)
MQLRVGDKTFRDVAHHDPTLTPWDVLRYSSNSGMINLTQRFSDKELYGWLDHIGFGRTMNVPSVAAKTGELRNTPWVPQDQAAITIGQSVSTTTLQLAALYNIFANDGVYLTPYVIEGDVTPAPRRVFSHNIALTMQKMLQYVVQQGSLNQVMPLELDIAGKTGTADIFDSRQGRYIHGDYTLSFAGFFPAEDPAITMVVSIQKPRKETMSTYVAAPLFANIARKLSALTQPTSTSSQSSEVTH